MATERRQDTAVPQDGAAAPNGHDGALPQRLRYEDLALGLRNYWYPVMTSRTLRKRPIELTLCGDEVLFLRRDGKAYAIQAWCPHRGMPLRLGKHEFRDTATLSCRYHGWTYDVSTGECVAALTDGPDSPTVGKVRLKTYPVEERAGLLWVWMGDT